MAPGLVVELHDVADTTVHLANDIAKQPSITTTTELITSDSTPTSPIEPLDPTLVLHPSVVTTEFDLLRFEAAAYDQLPKNDDSDTNGSGEKVYSTDLISSPYNSPGHFRAR